MKNKTVCRSFLIFSFLAKFEAAVFTLVAQKRNVVVTQVKTTASTYLQQIVTYFECCMLQQKLTSDALHLFFSSSHLRSLQIDLLAYPSVATGGAGTTVLLTLTGATNATFLPPSLLDVRCIQRRLKDRLRGKASWLVFALNKLAHMDGLYLLLCVDWQFTKVLSIPNRSCSQSSWHCSSVVSLD